MFLKTAVAYGFHGVTNNVGLADVKRNTKLRSITNMYYSSNLPRSGSPTASKYSV